MEVKSIIYKITNLKSGMKYIGQTVTHRNDGDTMYMMGIYPRLREHIGAANRGRNTPIAKAIRNEGPESFIIEELTMCDSKDADRLEMEYISKENSLYPKGYNVQEYSRCSGGFMFNPDDVEKVDLRAINANNTPTFVRAYVKLTGNINPKRLSFKGETFDESKVIAIAYFQPYIEKEKISLCPTLFGHNGFDRRISERLKQFEGHRLLSLRMVKYGRQHNIIAIDIVTDKVTKRVTFGGIKSTFDQAYNLADTFCTKLQIQCGKLINGVIKDVTILHSQQQAAASLEEGKQ